MQKSLIYLAMPYTGRMEESFIDANRISGTLMAWGYIVFSPISHSHPIWLACQYLPQTQEFWMEQDLAWLRKCDQLFVYKAKGWESSKGVQREIEEAKQLNMPIRYIEEGEI